MNAINFSLYFQSGKNPLRLPEYFGITPKTNYKVGVNQKESDKLAE
jgi:hypothetical protein